LFSVRSSGDKKLAQWIFGCLPAISFIIILFTLKVLASFDVVNDPFYLIYFIVFGYTCIYFGLNLMAFFFDLSWIDDVIYLNNKAALFSITGGFLGLTLIYSCANIGDGPGWWCVVFAGGLGLITWIILGLIINKLTHIFERITVERDIGCGVRVGLYFIASCIILGRASAGDWTSFSMTVVEFGDGWPVLPLTALMIVIELNYINSAKDQYKTNDNSLAGSLFFGIAYVLIAIIIIILLPSLPENPIYYSMFATFI